MNPELPNGYSPVGCGHNDELTHWDGQRTTWILAHWLASRGRRCQMWIRHVRKRWSRPRDCSQRRINGSGIAEPITCCSRIEGHKISSLTARTRIPTLRIRVSFALSPKNESTILAFTEIVQQRRVSYRLVLLFSPINLVRLYWPWRIQLPKSRR